MSTASIAAPVTIDPLLRWESIADHARTQHAARWASDDAALTAIVGAFDAILPDGFGYDPMTGAIDTEYSHAAPVPPVWSDVQMLACTIAALAGALPACDLQALHGTENFAARLAAVR
jgi:hypothetical protein